MGNHAAGALKKGLECRAFTGQVGFPGEGVDHGFQYGDFTAVPGNPQGHIQGQILDRCVLLIEFQLPGPQRQIRNTLQRIRAQFIHFLQGQNLLFGIRQLAGLQAFPDLFGEQGRSDFLIRERSGPFELRDQCCGRLIKGATCGAIHFFSNLSAAELMQ